jgi:P-type Cu+ transporter
VEESKTGRAKLEKMVDQVAKYFVPSIITIAIGVFFGKFFLGNAGLTYSILAFVSVIIIACPCALGLATSAALMMGIGKGAENGILYKGGEYIEVANKINTIVFYKTGTLTIGKPSVTDLILFTENNAKEQELLSYADIVESGSEHPLTQAIVRKAKENGHTIVHLTFFEAITGHGVKATYSNQVIIIDNKKIIKENNISITNSFENRLLELEKNDKTVVFVALNNKLYDAIAIFDTIKRNTKEVIDILKSNKIETIMLRGDNENTAKSVSSKIGIDKTIAQVLPHQKAEIISKLKYKEKKL